MGNKESFYSMKRSKVTKIIERVAANEGKSVAEVRESMQEAINIAYERRNETNETFWERFNGRVPPPDEFLVVANKEVLDRLYFGKTK
jgi:hypothetical protein